MINHSACSKNDYLKRGKDATGKTFILLSDVAMLLAQSKMDESVYKKEMIYMFLINIKYMTTITNKPNSSRDS